VTGLAYRTVIFDVDSTLSRIEGIEWLAALRGPDVASRITDVTERAMRGELLFEGIYAARLDAVRPTETEVAALGQAYIDKVTDGARDAVAALNKGGARVVIVSGGIRTAVLAFAQFLGVPERDVHAVPLRFDDNGEYAGYYDGHPCARQFGKRNLVTSLELERPSLAVGDGITDAEMKPVVDAFAAFTGVVNRKEIVDLADFELRNFPDLVTRILT
jgi:HAD superfamily phosphoserine phosphatase-like hydrolase